MIKLEYDKMLQFISLIAAETTNLRSIIQQSLYDVWGYDVMAFWYTDSNGNIDNPVLFGVSNEVIKDYMDNYESYDFLHPRLHIDRLHEQSIFNVENTISHENLHNKTYFTEFMQKYHFVDEMVVNFKFQNELIGTLGFLSKIENGYYDKVDIARFKTIANIISSRLIQEEKIEQLQNELSIFRRKMDKSSTGYIIMNENNNVLYCNESAIRVSDLIIGGSKLFKLDQLIEKIIRKYHLHGSSFSIHKNGRSYKCVCNYDISWTNSIKNNYCLFIQIDQVEEKNSKQFKEIYQLTERETQVLQAIAKGMKNKQIADHLYISINTVKKHAQNIFEKLKVNSRAEIIRLFYH